MSEYASPKKAASAQPTSMSAGRSMTPPAFQLKTAEPEIQPETEDKDLSARFKGDNALKGITDGKSTLKKGAHGIKVTKLQQALVDMGYLLPKYGVDGKFEGETKAALLQYQHDAGLTESGKFDQETIEALDARFDTRTDYLNAAADFDPADPSKGTRTLTSNQQKEAIKALTPQPAKPGAKFTETIGARNYGDEIKAKLTSEIATMHKDNFEDKDPLRADPAKNFHKDADLEGAANAGRDATDQVYGNLNKGPAFVMGTNLMDFWKSEKAINDHKSDDSKQKKARRLVQYFIESECVAINSDFSADPSGTQESKILEPIIDSFTDTPAKAQVILEIFMGWIGGELGDTQFIQVFKESDDEKNRQRMWEIFHVSIHEYIHTLREKRYDDWAKKLGGSKKHTLIEGFADFFSMNVRAKYDKAALKAFQQKVEGSFHDPVAPKPIPDFDGTVYDANAEAERMVGIIGIHNAQMGYFKGEIDLMGGV